HGSASTHAEDAERPGLSARRPVLRPRRGPRTQRARRMVLRGAARSNEAGRSLDRFLERRRDQVSRSCQQRKTCFSTAAWALTLRIRPLACEACVARQLAWAGLHRRLPGLVVVEPLVQDS